MDGHDLDGRDGLSCQATLSGDKPYLSHAPFTARLLKRGPLLQPLVGVATSEWIDGHLVSNRHSRPQLKHKEGECMKVWILCIIGALAFWVTSAVAQTSQPGANPQGAPGSAMPNQQTSRSPGMQQPETGPIGATEQSSENTGATQSESHLKGCIESVNGQSMLETKKGNEIALTGRDVAAQVGHEVRLKGT
jgi:hypothetical protein